MDILPKPREINFAPDTMKAVRKLYNLENGKLEETVEKLNNWVTKQDHFLFKNFGKEYLEKIIIWNEGSEDRAKDQLDMLCTLRTLVPMYYESYNVLENSNSSLDLFTVVCLPKLTNNLRKVIVVKPANPNMDQEKAVHYHKNLVISIEYAMANNYCDGYIVLLDYRRLDVAALATKIDFIELQHFFILLFRGYNVKIKEMHILTNAKMTCLLVRILKGLLKAEISKRISIHKSIKSLKTCLSEDVLPEDYDGKEESLDKIREKWMQAVSSKEFMLYLDDIRSAVVDEKRRPKDQFKINYLGLPHTIRNLDID